MKGGIPFEVQQQKHVDELEQELANLKKIVRKYVKLRLERDNYGDIWKAFEEMQNAANEGGNDG